MPPSTRPSKRQASTTLNKPRRKKQKKSSTPQPFRLLDLPTELLDMILQFAALDSGTFRHAFLRRTSPKSTLGSHSSLMLVSHFLHDQYQNTLNTFATPVFTTVKNFDFTHVVRFLNKLSARELHTLPQANQPPSPRKFIINLALDESAGRNPDLLLRWMLRLDHPTKKGSAIEVKYTRTDLRTCRDCNMPCLDCACERMHDFNFPVLKTLGRWIEELDDGRLRNKAKKIESCLRQRRPTDHSLSGSLGVYKSYPCWERRCLFSREHLR